MDLTNAPPIVTGGAGGFGSATVRRLAKIGARFVIGLHPVVRRRARRRFTIDVSH
jgi:NAD(P)-dependent dehydrogenase (short-subunit alcohol dehydrogenase family)